jgi:WD40 repeat protein
MIKKQKHLFALVFAIAAFHFCASGQLYKLSKTVRDFSSNPCMLIAKSDEPVLIQGNTDGSIIFRSSITGAIENKIMAHSKAINGFGFNTTNNLLISTCVTGEIRVYDFEEKKIINKLSAPEYSGMKFAAFSVADGFIYFNGYNRLYKTRSDLTQEVLKIYDFTDSINAGVITPDRRALILALGKYIYVINPRTDEIMQQLYTGNSPVERLYMLPTNGLLSWSSDGTIQIWKFTLGQLETAPIQWFKAGTPSNVSFSHDGRYMVTGNVGNWVRIWNPSIKKIEQELIGHQSAVNGYAFAPGDSILFTASNDLSLKIWKTRVDSLPPSEQNEKKAAKNQPAATPPQAVLREPVNPDVKMLPRNVPEHVRNRSVNKTETIKVNKPNIDVYIYDNHLVDGDTLSIFFNGEWVLRNYGVVKEKKMITLKLLENTNNYMVLFAENLGTKPPNSAVVYFVDGNQKRYITLNSDMTQCSAINFVYKK